MRKLLFGLAVVLVVCFAAYLRFRHSDGPLEVAYAGNRETTLWSTTAQVRESVGTAHYGDRLEILARSQDQVQVRTASGLTGWMTENELLSAALWQKAKDLDSQAAAEPVEARGHLRAISNLHVAPGRETPRVRQIAKTIPVDLFERQVVTPPTTQGTPPTMAPKDATSADGADAKPAESKKEDWWFVRAHLPDQTTVSGWILGRFVDLDVPEPLPDYASSAGMHVVAWFELNHVLDVSGALKPQYLLVGTKGAEGQPCDFSLMRAYTWGEKRQRYETAFVESDVCGKLPLNLKSSSVPGGDATFSFEDSSDGVSEQRTYRMHQTIIRREREGGSPPKKRKHAHG
jgi:hypothetical protein